MTAAIEAGGWVLDTAALAEAAQHTDYAAAMLAVSRARALTLAVPASVLAVVCQTDPAAWDHLADVRGQRGPWLLVWPGDTVAERARRNALAVIAGTAEAVDYTAADVVITAQARGWPVVTGRVDQLGALASGLMFIPVG